MLFINRNRPLFALWGALFLFLLACLLFLCVTGVLFSQLPVATAAQTVPSPHAERAFTVVLDAGHGGHDSGALSESGTAEKDLNLALTLKTANFLRACGLRVVLTRSDDTLPDIEADTSRKQREMLARIDCATRAQADLFLSIHMNSFPAAVCEGAQAFYSTTCSESEVLARTLQQAISTLLQTDNRRTAKESSSIFLLKHLKMPSALLECGFLSNEEELSLLTDEEYQSKLAFCIGAAVLQYINA